MEPGITRQGCWLKLVMITATTSIVLPLATSMPDVCSLLSNPDCSCANSTVSSSPANVFCTFNASSSPTPIFSFSSSLNASTVVGVLDLSGNSLEDLPDDLLPGGLVVEKMVLRQNRLSGIPAVVSRLGSVEVLDLSNNSLTMLSVVDLLTVQGLRSLDVSDNSVSRLRLNVDGNEEDTTSLPNLKELNLSGNAIDSIQGEIFGPMTKLVNLDLSRNLLTAVTSSTFSHLGASLTTLHLSSNVHLRYVDSQAFHRLSQLRELSLAHSTGLTHNVVGTIALPQHLQILDLSDCALPSLNFCQLSALSDLQWLSVDGNDFNCSCELYRLFLWYLNRRRSAGRPEPVPLESPTETKNWSCRATDDFTVTSAATVSDNDDDNATTKAGLVGGGARLVEELQGYCANYVGEPCSREDDRSPVMLEDYSQMKISLDATKTDDHTLAVRWTVRITEGQTLAVDGFRLRYLPENGEMETSPVAPADSRSMLMQPDQGLEDHFSLCLDVLVLGGTAVAYQTCLSFKPPKEEDVRNAVVGILAGVIFLLPCALALVYICFKDRRMLGPHADPQYRPFPVAGEEGDVEKQTALKQEETKKEEDKEACCASKDGGEHTQDTTHGEIQIEVNVSEESARGKEASAAASTAVAVDVATAESPDAGLQAVEGPSDQEFGAHDLDTSSASREHLPCDGSRVCEGVVNPNFAGEDI